MTKDKFILVTDERNYMVKHKPPGMSLEPHYFPSLKSMFKWVSEFRRKGFITRGRISFPTTDEYESIDSVIDKAGDEVFDWVLSLKKNTDKNVA